MTVTVTREDRNVSVDSVTDCHATPPNGTRIDGFQDAVSWIASSSRGLCLEAQGLLAPILQHEPQKQLPLEWLRPRNKSRTPEFRGKHTQPASPLRPPSAFWNVPPCGKVALGAAVGGPGSRSSWPTAPEWTLCRGQPSEHQPSPVPPLPAPSARPLLGACSHCALGLVPGVGPASHCLSSSSTKTWLLGAQVTSGLRGSAPRQVRAAPQGCWTLRVRPAPHLLVPMSHSSCQWMPPSAAPRGIELSSS